MKRNTIIKYAKYWELDPTEEIPVKKAVYAYKKLATNNYRRYSNSLRVLAGAERSARDLLDYLCERMDNNNNVTSSAKLREQFIEDIKKWTNQEVIYTDSTVKKAMHTLIKRGVLLKTEKRGSLIVNPEYFFKGVENYREEKVKKRLDEAGKKQVKIIKK